MDIKNRAKHFTVQLAAFCDTENETNFPPANSFKYQSVLANNLEASATKKNKSVNSSLVELLNCSNA